MATNRKIRVGIIGANPSRGFASVAHIPALQSLPDFEICAVCTTRQDSAEAAARHYGVPLAFCGAEKLAQHTDVDLVTVSVKVPDHYLPVMAAIEAGKHVYCEWPLGRNTDEAVRMRDAANRKGIRHAVGLQGQVSPAINYTKDLIADGYVGRVLSATMIGCRPELGTDDIPCLPSRFRERRQPADDHRRAYDRCAMLLPRRISRACRVRREPTRPHTARGNRRADRQNRARPTRRQRHCRRGCRRILSDPWRHEPRDGVPVRDPRRRGRPPADGHLTSLYAAAGTECERGSR